MQWAPNIVKDIVSRNVRWTRHITFTEKTRNQCIFWLHRHGYEVILIYRLLRY
jgi:hypothetical protein